MAFRSILIVTLLLGIGAAQADVTDADLERASGGRTIAVGAVSNGGGVTNVPLEMYVARVLAGEGEPNAPEAATQALAIAIRTYAIVNLGRHAREGFDLCDTTHCQVPRTATAATRRAALATAGQVLLFNGAPAPVYYSASCGGRSEDASEVWPGVNYPYMRSVVDDVHDEDVPWTLDLSFRQVEQALTKAGFDGRLEDVRIEDRDRSGRVSRLRLKGLEPQEMTGAQFRMALGPTDVRSTAFSMTKQGTMLHLTGRGYGHGVGMCVIGAGRRARRGQTAEAILRTYYPGLRLAPLAGITPAPAVETASLRSRAGTAEKPVAAAVAGRPSGILVHVPKGSSLTASDLERLGARANDALSRTLGTSVAPLTIELHDSIESFRSATGQPWWVSEVAAGTTIDLAPAALLRQRDGLEPTLRRAIAELLVSAPLAGRPAWVRVGAARYFSRDVHPPAHGGKVRCPADAELTLAISAAAQRDAESRAEDCFAREIAQGRDWRDVR